MKPTIQTRQVELPDCDQMMALMNRNYARQRPLDYFRWQYFDYPWPVVCWGAFDNQKLVGMFGLQRKPLSTGGVIDQVIDIVIDADFRGLGLFRTLYEGANSALGGDAPQMVLANPSGKEACVRRLGYTQVAQIDSLRLLPEKLRNETAPAAECPETSRIRLAFDQDLKRWRFSLHPVFRYQMFEGPNESLLVGKIYGEGADSQGDLVYFTASPSTSEWIRACESLFAQGVRQVNCWAFPGTRERSALLALGFEPQAQERFLCVSGPPELRDAEQWAIVQADTEHF